MRRFCVLLLLGLVLGACSSSSDVSLSFGDLPPGEPNSGAKLFQQSIQNTPRCADCHAVDDSSSKIGPSLVGMGSVAGERVSGESAEEYVFNSIVRPGAYMVRGFSNVMYNQYAEKLSPQDIADLIVYVLSL